jgi:predicted small lipoprotein YifL
MQYTIVGKIALLALFGCLTLSGCGFKGALYLPEKDTNEVTK